MAGTADAVEPSPGDLLGLLTAHLRHVVTTTDEAAISLLDGLAAVHDISARLEQTAAALEACTPVGDDGLADRVRAASRQLADGCSDVRDLATSMMGDLQFQDVTRQMVEGVVNALDAIADSGALADGLRSGYVMHTQRRTHAEVVGDAFTDEEIGVDLF